tara:strand:- start:2623 stop:4740 length:2118 start_codon:yes stop_codon:yes gene_type:complete
MSRSKELYSRWRYRLFPDHMIGEVLSKNWIDNAIPFLILIFSVVFFSSFIDDLLAPYSLLDNGRHIGELLLVVFGMTIVMIAGGIDLSVGATFALATFCSLGLFNYFEMPLGFVIFTVLLLGALIGALNGFLIGFLRLRAFLTTLVTLIIVRAIFDTLVLNYQVEVTMAARFSNAWDFIGDGDVMGIPFSFFIAAIIGIFAHVMLTRLGLGWRIQAVGGSRRSAFNAGISVRKTVFYTYVMSGILAATAGIFYASRLGAAGSDTGLGLEVSALTAAVLGGISLGGGRGSVTKALLGALIVVIIQSSLIRMGLRSGANTLALGVLLLAAVAIDVKWLKNRVKVLDKVYVSPAYMRLPDIGRIDKTSIYADNDRLRNVDLIGLEEVEGPEDVILDDNDNLYCGSRHGDVIRFFAPDHKRWEVFGHIGGHPLGMAFDKKGNLNVCVSGMGLYQITPNKEVRKLTDETNRSLLSVIDDSRMRFADDLDIAPNGKIYFSEATIRFSTEEWMIDALESRGNGRIICYDPITDVTKTIIPNLMLPNGICVEKDGKSLLFAETWPCRISRYWLEGPRKGKIDPVIPDLPGYPDNINRSSDGHYWCAFVGMRSPAFDLAQRMPAFRKKMVDRLPHDEWLYPNMNAGCVIKFDKTGKVLECLWDSKGVNHPMITSMREHKGYLYLGGSLNNRIGKWKIPDGDLNWTGFSSYWGDD